MFRSFAAGLKKGKFSQAFLMNEVVPVSLFFKHRAAESSYLLQDAFLIVDNLLDVISGMWRVALSLDRELKEQVASFRSYCVDTLDIHADWSFLQSEYLLLESPLVEGPQLLLGLIEKHLQTRFPWQKPEELLAKQKEMVITKEMIKGLESPKESPKEEKPNVQTPPRVLKALRELR